MLFFDKNPLTKQLDSELEYFLLDRQARNQELTDLTVGDVALATGQMLVRMGKGHKGRATARVAPTGLPTGG